MQLHELAGPEGNRSKHVIAGVTTTPIVNLPAKIILRYFKVFPFRAILYIKHFFNILRECTLIFNTYFIISLLHVSVCYVYHLQGESLIRTRWLCASNTRFSLKMVFITHRKMQEIFDKNYVLTLNVHWVGT
jgi:hypothetical protein